MNNNTHRRGSMLTIQLTLAAMLMAQFWPAQPSHAAPSQMPLLNRPNLAPPANVMFTLDDSGSMTYQYMPERSFTLNGQTVDFPNDGKIFLHPGELTVNRFTFVSPTENMNHRDTRYVTAAPHTDISTGMALLQAQMRSPHVNRLYYNPYVRYTPWKTADGRPYDNATASQAWLLPSYLHPDTPDSQRNSSTEFVNLQNDGNSPLVRWYCRAQSDWTECDEPDHAYTALTYNPALFYMLTAGGNPNDLAQYERYNINTRTATFTWPVSSTPDVPGASARTDCTRAPNGASVTCTPTQELQNYANWFVFYRSRLLVAQGKIPEALSGSVGDIRLGWGTIHPNRVNTTDNEWSAFFPDSDLGSTVHPSATVQRGVRPLDGGHLADFTDWLRGLSTVRRTPTLHAMYSVGEYFLRDDLLSPWQTNFPSNGAQASALTCRRSYHLMVTDGYYQADDELDAMFTQAGMNVQELAIGNFDEDNTMNAGDGVNHPVREFPGTRASDGRLLTRRAFTDGLDNTLADHAMRLWLIDLQPGINDGVEPIDNRTDEDEADPTSPGELLKEVQGNPATWQHLTHLMVGFGVTGTLPKSDATLLNMVTPASTVAWPSTLDPVDDLWHAAVNSRGEYFSASNPEELQASLQNALGKPSSIPRKEAGLATASSQLLDGNIKYVPQYNPRGWTGNIQAFELNDLGKAAAEPEWSAATNVPPAATRTIVTWQSRNTTSEATNPAPVDSHQAVSFVHANLDTATKGVLSEKLVRYIRGEDLAQPSQGSPPITESWSEFRERETLLSDFVNSTPLFVGRGTNLGYGNSTGITGSASYSGSDGFLASKAARTDNLLFIGGNGGMLHAFSTSDGVERFAFIPKAAIPKLPLVASRRYGRPDTPHQFVVDGQLVESDVFIVDGTHPTTGTPQSAWRNIVVGTMGAGGKAVYALKLPTSDLLSINASNVLWETSHEDMGYITTAPRVGYTPQGWKVFVGNGVDSDTGRTALLVIDVQTGAVQSIPVDAGNTIDTQHGLGGVTLSRDATGMVQAVYAGDTQGRLWRFDVGANGAVSAGYGGAPIFVATNANNQRQPILAAPYITPHPKGGRLIVFNTGRLLYNDDVSNLQIQSAYGIWEQLEAGVTSIDVTSPNPTRNDLVAQRILSRDEVTQVGGDETRSFFNVSRIQVDWSTKQGWMFDLVFPDSTASNTTFSYPKALYEPRPFLDSVVISSVKPASEVQSCDTGKGRGYGLLLDVLTGGASLAAMDTNGDGLFSDLDGSQSGYTYDGGPLTVLTGEDGPTNPCTPGSIQSSDDDLGIKRCPEFRSIKDRIWRQLLNPPAP